MKRVTPYLKMRVLGAIEFAPGGSVVERIKHVSRIVFSDEDAQRCQFTWRTIQTWYSRYKKESVAASSCMTHCAARRPRSPPFRSSVRFTCRVPPATRGTSLAAVPAIAALVSMAADTGEPPPVLAWRDLFLNLTGIDLARCRVCGARHHHQPATAPPPAVARAVVPARPPRHVMNAVPHRQIPCAPCLYRRRAPVCPRPENHVHKPLLAAILRPLSARRRPTSDPIRRRVHLDTPLPPSRRPPLSP